MVQQLGQFKAHAPAHRADSGAGNRLQNRRFAGSFYHGFPVAFVPGKGLGGKVTLFLLDMELVVRSLDEGCLFAGDQF